MRGARLNHQEIEMKIVVIGGTGLIGKQVVAGLQKLGHETIAAAPSQGINAVTGEGLAEALRGAQVVVDVSNSPSFEENAVLAFFEASTRNLIAAEKVAGVAHHVALSIVGTDRIPGNAYFRAKVAQEALIKSGKVPYTLVRATQFYEFMGGIAHTGAQGDIVHLSTGNMQPIAAEDVAAAMVSAALGAPLNGTTEIAGPEKAPLAEFVIRYMKATGDARQTVAGPQELYFGAPIETDSLTPHGRAHLGAVRYEDWLSRNAAQQ
jgi:uncharacterized protein YbjT (DUF2867 family)